MIPKKTQSGGRLLQANNSNSSNSSNLSSFYASMTYNVTSNTSLEIKTFENISVVMPCMNSCVSCDETGQVCYECELSFALVDKKCETLNISETYYNDSYYSNSTYEESISYINILNTGNLAGLVIFCIFEMVTLVLAVLFSIHVMKNRKKTNIENKPKIEQTKTNKNDLDASPTIFSPTHTQV